MTIPRMTKTQRQMNAAYDPTDNRKQFRAITGHIYEQDAECRRGAACAVCGFAVAYHARYARAKEQARLEALSEAIRPITAEYVHGLRLAE